MIRSFQISDRERVKPKHKPRSTAQGQTTAGLRAESLVSRSEAAKLKKKKYIEFMRLHSDSKRRDRWRKGGHEGRKAGEMQEWRCQRVLRWRSEKCFLGVVGVVSW